MKQFSICTTTRLAPPKKLCYKHNTVIDTYPVKEHNKLDRP